MLVTFTLIVFVPVVVLMSIIPYLTRQIESFGVTVPIEAQSKTELVSMRRRYTGINLSAGAVLLALTLWTHARVEDEAVWAASFTSYLLGYILLSFVNYLFHHRAVKKLKQRERWITPVQQVLADTKFRTEKLIHSYAWFVPHIVLIVITVGACLLWYDRFPELLPMKYSVDGDVVRSVEKSYSSLLMPAAIQCFLLVVFIFTNFMIGRSKQLVEGSQPEVSLKRNIMFRRRWSAFLIILSFILLSLFSFIQLSMLVDLPSYVIQIVPLIVVGIILVGTIWMSYSTGQGGSRIKVTTATKSERIPVADQDEHWKLGQFYFNPKDPTLFVEKRFGIGWTMNFGQPLSWVILLIIVAIPIMITLISS